MPLYSLDPYHMMFPDPRLADDNGLLAVGGKLSVDWLLLAYESGVFPWFNPEDPILWWSPDPRCILLPDEVYVQKSMHRVLNNPDWEFRMDTAFAEVVDRCAHSGKRLGKTWITPELARVYNELHRIGVAHSAEAWVGGKLVGGLFGVGLGAAFFGESMYSERNNASKFVLIRFCHWLSLRDYHFLDCQLPSPHLLRMGAGEVSRDRFLDLLDVALVEQTHIGIWHAGDPLKG